MIHTLTHLPRNWVDPILRASQARTLIATPGHVLLAPDEKAATGHLLAHLPQGASADILTLFIREPHRRQGHAEALVADLMLLAQARECPAITMEVRAGNLAARALYEKCGFTQATTRPAYYSEPTEDAVVYTIAL